MTTSFVASRPHVFKSDETSDVTEGKSKPKILESNLFVVAEENIGRQ